ncbi:MAG: beta strand repeat-containing protein [Flagellimonas sp.]
MKTKILKLSMLSLATLALVFTSCSGDDNDPTPPTPEATCDDGVQNGDETGVDCGGSCDACPTETTVLTGSISEDTELDASETYVLQGSLSVESGATLTIPAGTTITAEVESGEETSTYIVVQKGGMIDVQGTEGNPVILTSENGQPGDWGGLVIAGDATTTEGVDAEAEVGGIIYGGTDDADNSGSIDYLIINYAGAQINSESQYNGLTLYAVGSGTTISNVAILNGTDDGVEFFGGTVSASNFYLENNEDDAIDWTEGWNGTLTNAYVVHTAGFSTVVEADGANENPSLVNLTAVSSVGGTALQFKKESGATITGLSLSGYDTSVLMSDAGPLANVQIEGADANPNLSYVGAPTVDVEMFGWVNSAIVIEESQLSGSLTTDLTLDPAVDYFLQGSFSVESGATLTIPAGTRIVADVEEGDETNTYIVVQKGGMIDIQGTANDPVVMTSSNEEPGDWGGLVIAGDATTTEGVDAEAEVGGIIYGGTNDADSSGSIEYLILNFAGAQINSESQYNGLTLYAVGSGTTIDNVAILNGTDDGVEFFGGTVSASNFYLENNEDDAIDWTEGWNGTLTNAYVLHTSGFSTVVEADGANENPNLVNLTAVSTVGGTALQFKKESGATITGLSLAGYETSVLMSDAGPLANVQIEGADADPAETYAAVATVNIDDFAWATGNAEAQSATLTGSISSTLTLDADVTYYLNQSFSVEDGATLNIPAGTTIIADVQDGDETNTYIVVQKGGTINVQGTSANPVVMTSSNETPGDWGGLVIAGNATTTEGVDAEAEVGGIIYGGTEDEDNSGSIEYLIINYAGAQINSESQYNGLTLYAVGSGTTIDNVAILNGTDDGVEFFGGTVSASNFYLENNEDDAIDWTEGWNGTLTNAYVLHTSGFSTVVEADGANENPSLVNLTAVSTVGGTALQFKKESGATITGLSLDGYDTSVLMSDNGPLANVQIEGATADPAETYAAAVTVDVTIFDWATN